MRNALRTTLAAAVAATGAFAADSACAQWGYPGPAYHHAPYAPSFSPGRFSIFESGYRSGYYGSSFGYGYSAYGPAYGYSAYGSSAYGLPAYGAVSRPRGRLKYDVYTPFGRQEVKYKFRRNGRIDVDIDD